MINTKERIRTGKERNKPRPKYKVIMYNDDTTTMDFVVFVLIHVFYYDSTDAINIMLQIHTGDKMVVAIYPQKLAYAKKNETLAIAKKNGFNDFKVEVEEA